MRRRILGAIVSAALALPASASAGAAGAGPPLGLDECETVEGVSRCTGLVPTWDGVPLDVSLVLPEADARRLPLVAEISGFGNSKWEYLDPASRAYTDNAYNWARAGYAVLTYTARGLWGSCGAPEARLASPAACARGWLHLADVRYEVRDAQHLIGLLVDAGVADRRRIGATGDSYGGGQSLMLAALRDRVMLPDGTLTRWRSPAGRPLRLAAAAPVIPWSDLITAAAPNGRVSAGGVTSRATATQPLGVPKMTYINGIFAAAQFATGPGQPVGEPFVPGRPMGFLSPPGVDPEADVVAIVARTDAGEPYTDASARRILEVVARYRSAYYIEPSRPPPPLLMASGFTDDLFPVDEVLRFANRTKRLYPRVPVSLLLGDFGHQRAANKPRERRNLVRAIHVWFDHYLRGEQRKPRTGVTAFAQTCPRSAPPYGPFHARSLAALADGRIRFRTAEAQTVSSAGIDPEIGVDLDPVTGGDGCVSVPAGSGSEIARYALAAPARRPLTLIGAPAISAELDVGGADPHVTQLAGRLWDVSPDGTRQLIARGFYRPDQGANEWELHPAAWRLRRGHGMQLELLGADIPYGRPSNAVFSIEIEKLRFSVPTRR